MKLLGLTTGDMTLIGGLVVSVATFYVWIKVSIAKINLRLNEVEMCLGKHKDENREDFIKIDSKLDKILFLLIEKNK